MQQWLQRRSMRKRANRCPKTSFRFQSPLGPSHLPKRPKQSPPLQFSWNRKALQWLRQAKRGPQSRPSSRNLWSFIAWFAIFGPFSVPCFSCRPCWVGSCLGSRSWHHWNHSRHSCCYLGCPSNWDPVNCSDCLYCYCLDHHRNSCFPTFRVNCCPGNCLDSGFPGNCCLHRGSCYLLVALTF